MAKQTKFYKFIRVLDNDVHEINDLLSTGWQVDKMTACAAGSEYHKLSYCYVLLSKKI